MIVSTGFDWECDICGDQFLTPGDAGIHQRVCKEQPPITFELTAMDKAVDEAWERNR